MLVLAMTQLQALVALAAQAAVPRTALVWLLLPPLTSHMTLAEPVSSCKTELTTAPALQEDRANTWEV